MSKTILLAEDSEADARLFHLTCADAFDGWTIEVTSDGKDALDFLYSRGRFAGRPRPSLVVLDLNMPKVNGWDVLCEMRRDETLRKVPTVVFSSTQAQDHIARAYECGACCFVNKPIDLYEYEKVCRSIAEFWTRIACIPQP